MAANIPGKDDIIEIQCLHKIQNTIKIQKYKWPAIGQSGAKDIIFHRDTEFSAENTKSKLMCCVNRREPDRLHKTNEGCYNVKYIWIYRIYLW